MRTKIIERTHFADFSRMPTSPAQRREWGVGAAAKVAMPQRRRATDQHQHVRVEIPRADEPRSCNTAAGVTHLTTRRDLENFRFRVWTRASEIWGESARPLLCRRAAGEVIRPRTVSAFEKVKTNTPTPEDRQQGLSGYQARIGERMLIQASRGRRMLNWNMECKQRSNNITSSSNASGMFFAAAVKYVYLAYNE